MFHNHFIRNFCHFLCTIARNISFFCSAFSPEWICLRFFIRLFLTILTISNNNRMAWLVRFRDIYWMIKEILASLILMPLKRNRIPSVHIDEYTNLHLHVLARFETLFSCCLLCTTLDCLNTCSHNKPMKILRGRSAKQKYDLYSVVQFWRSFIE